MEIELSVPGASIWDVVVVGAGPAGATAARLLSIEGHSVLLVDRSGFPRNKVCGCCLNGAALNSLEATGLGRLPATLGAPELEQVELIGYGRRVDLPLPGGRVLSRKALDMALIEAARDSGTIFLPETVATLGESTREGWSVELKPSDDSGTRDVVARVVVCADGLSGGFLRRHSRYAPTVAVASRIGVGLIAEGAESDLRRGVIRMVVAPEGYVGVVRLEDGSLDVAAALDRSQLGQNGPETVVRRILRSSGALSDFEVTWGLKGTPPLTRHRRVIGDRRLFMVGDATGYVEPFTGEGIAWAMNSALLVTPLVVKACRNWDDSIAADWEQIHRTEIGRRQAVCRILRSILARPRVSRLLLASLAVSSFWARPFIAGLNRPIIERH
jgi:flavin-dependent dehydrogenase